MRFLGFSLALHFLALLPLFFLRNSPGTSSEVKIIPSVELVELDARGKPGSDADLRKGQVSRGGRSARVGRKPVDWKIGGAGGAGAISRDRGSKFGASVPWQHESGPGRAIAEKLRRRIEPFLFYPSRHRQAGLMGTVDAEILVRPTGFFLDRVNGDDDLLENFVREALGRALGEKDPLPVKTTESLPYTVRVEFRATGDSLQPVVLGRRLQFVLAPRFERLVALRKADRLDGATKPHAGSRAPELVFDGVWGSGPEELSPESLEEEREVLRRRERR